MEEMSCVFLFTCFSLSLIFTLVAASISHFLTAAREVHVVLPTKNVSFVFLELHRPVALLSLFFCLFLSLYSKFVDMTINLSLIIYTTRIQKHFPFSIFVFIDSFVVLASQDAGGHIVCFPA